MLEWEKLYKEEKREKKKNPCLMCESFSLVLYNKLNCVLNWILSHFSQMTAGCVKLLNKNQAFFFF